MTSEGIRILVVDDDEDVLRGTVHLLERKGYVTATATNGVEALHTLQAFHPQLVLTDRQMPELDGVELCRRIKADPALEGVFVILISGQYTQSGEQAEGLESGADGYITRPITNRELLARVESYVRIVRLQIHLNQARKMETVGLLAGSVAHNFNNLLMGILGHAELSLDNLPQDHPVRPFLNEITSGVERSAALIRHLLAISSKQTIAPKVLDINDTIVDILALMHHHIGENIEVEWVPGKKLWSVKLDPAHLNQILTSLCTNARDAIARKIVITTANIVVDPHLFARFKDATPGEYVQLSVRDDGCGMDSPTLDRLFEPFFTTKDLSLGAGLGLASVHGSVRQNNGFIAVDSEVGKGSTFKIYFPRVVDSPVPSAVAGAPAKRIDGSTKTILLVDEDKAVRVIVRIFLKKLGYSVLEAQSAEEALNLAALHAGPIHLLLTEAIMWGTNGRQLAELIQTARADTKCLLMSNFTADELTLLGDLAPGIPFLSKPFGRDLLGQKVSEILDD